MKHNIISIFLLTLIAINAKADDFNYYVNSFNTENGLTQNDITSITQDCTGFIWMATNNGLNRLDGYRTTTFKHSLDSMKNSIYSNLITSITADSANCIWIANRKEGIDCYDTETNSFNHFLAYHDNDKTIPLDNVNKIYYCKDSQEAEQKVREIMKENDIIYFKGSNSMYVNKIVEDLKRDFMN